MAVERATPERGMRLEASVVHAFDLTPNMRRITIGGADVAGFLSADGVDAPGAWVKVFPPGSEGRAYTIRRIDRAKATLDLDLDFVLHGDGGAHAGPVAAWAARARAHDAVGFAGPRNGGFELPEDARWVLLAGDATALPAIQSIAESLATGMRLKTYVEVPTEADMQEIRTAASLRTCWITQRGDAPGLALQQRLMHQPQPPGPGYVWMAGESIAMRTLKAHFLGDLGLARHRLGVKGYWKRGEADHRDRS